jgi:hypothetical protein
MGKFGAPTVTRIADGFGFGGAELVAEHCPLDGV